MQEPVPAMCSSYRMDDVLMGSERRSERVGAIGDSDSEVWAQGELMSGAWCWQHCGRV